MFPAANWMFLDVVFKRVDVDYRTKTSPSLVQLSFQARLTKQAHLNMADNFSVLL